MGHATGRDLRRCDRPFWRRCDRGPCRQLDLLDRRLLATDSDRKAAAVRDVYRRGHCGDLRVGELPSQLHLGSIMDEFVIQITSAVVFLPAVAALLVLPFVPRHRPDLMRWISLATTVIVFL